MKNRERVAALKQFGYDDDESRFLVLAALQGGYFLRRQFLAFVDGTKGWKDVVFLKKLAANKHCRTTVYRHERLVHHLSSKPLYDALGEPANRNRREHQPSTIKNKIMCLDFVLEHHAYDYLSTEQDKLAYFLQERALTPEVLPSRLYPSPNGHAPIAKHFVGSYPIFLSSSLERGHPTMPRPHFTYIDEGLQTTDRFATFLKQNAGIFVALGDVQVTYVAESPRLFASAERVFQKFVRVFLHSADPEDAELQRLVAYFERRRRYDNQDFSDFDTASLIQFREEKKLFAAEAYESLYRSWRDGDPSLVGRDPHLRSAFQKPSRGHFSTFLLNHDYELFGTLMHRYNKLPSTELQTVPVEERFGAELGSRSAGTFAEEGSDV